MMPVARSVVRAVAGCVAPSALLALRGPGRRRRVALTFDDGPTASTAQYLQLLERKAVRATFFIVGGLCRGREDTVAEVARRGHQVGSHGFSHRRFTILPSDEIRSELTRTRLLLPPDLDGKPLVRPPHGDTSLRSLAVCALAGYRTVLWSLDSGDGRECDPHAIAARVAPPRSRPGDIVLLHEGQPWTLAALPRIIDGLRGEGFELVTVNQLLEP